MIKNKRGISLVEIIVSIGLISIVLVMILVILGDIRNEETLSKYRATNLINQSFVIKAVQDDMLSDTLTRVESCSDLDGCLRFTFASKVKILKFNTEFIYYGNDTLGFESWTFYNSEIGNATTPKITVFNRPEMAVNNMNYLKIVIPVIDKITHYRYDIEIFFIYKVTSLVIGI